MQQAAGAAGAALFVAIMSAQSATQMAGGAEAVEALASGIRAAFVVGASISVLAFAAAFFVQRPPMQDGGWSGGHLYPDGGSRSARRAFPGFLGGQVALALLAAGHEVRGSVRDPGKAARVRAALTAAGADVSRLDFVTLDLLDDAGWDAAMDGVRYVQHTASPFVTRMPADRMAAGAAGGRGHAPGHRGGVAARRGTGGRDLVGGGHRLLGMAGRIAGRTPPRTGPISMGPASTPILNSSSCVREREARALMAAAGRTGDLVTINPGVIFGPLLDDDPGTSVEPSETAPRRRPAGGGADRADRRRCARRGGGACGGDDDTGRGRAAHPDGQWQLFAAADGADFGRGTAGASGKDAALRGARLDGAAGGPCRPRHSRGIEGELGVVKRLDGGAGAALLGRPLIAAEEAIAASARSLVARGLA